MRPIGGPCLCVGAEGLITMGLLVFYLLRLLHVMWYFLRCVDAALPHRRRCVCPTEDLPGGGWFVSLYFTFFPVFSQLYFMRGGCFSASSCMHLTGSVGYHTGRLGKSVACMGAWKTGVWF